MELYLVTGFLGAGKTTSIKHLLGEFKDKKVALIINEFGKQGIDGQLLRGYDVALKEVNNGSIFCACKMSHFENVLEEIIQQSPEIILVETSGLSDPTLARQIIEQDKFKSIIYKGCAAIVDAVRCHKVLQTVSVSRKQIRIADSIYINKVDCVTETQLEVLKEVIQEYNPYAVLETITHGGIKQSMIESMVLRKKEKLEEALKTRDLTLQKRCIVLSESCTYHQLKHIIKGFIEETYRIKGIVTIEGENYLVDCVADDLVIKPYEGQREGDGNQLIVLSGEGKNVRKRIEEVRALYCEQFISVTT